MNNLEYGAPAPELVVPEIRPIVPVAAGLIAVRGAIGETFRMADAYARQNRHLVGYNVSEFPSDLQIMHRDADTGERTKLAIYDDTLDVVWGIEIDIDRGTRTQGGYRKVDTFELVRTGDDMGLLHERGTKYESRLVVKDAVSDEFIFGPGIGPKRQDRAAKILLIMQDRLRRLSEVN